MQSMQDSALGVTETWRSEILCTVYTLAQAAVKLPTRLPGGS